MNGIRLKKALENLYHKNIYIGTSSWNYEGWKNLIYFKNYKNKKDFFENSIKEYSSIFQTVGIDYTYYDWPKEEVIKKYYEETPQHFVFALKVTDKITIYKYPKLKKFSSNAGSINEFFLNADLFYEKFIKPIEPYKTKIGPIIFEFSHFYPEMNFTGRELVERLDFFFEKFKNNFIFCVEIRNSNWLEPLYFETLKKHGVFPVLNSWTKMPSLEIQLQKCEKYKFNSLISRILLQPGFNYKTAVKAFYPYNKIGLKNEKLRIDVANIIKSAIKNEQKVFIYVNNRAEGSAPMTIDGILEKL